MTDVLWTVDVRVTYVACNNLKLLNNFATRDHLFFEKRKIKNKVRFKNTVPLAIHVTWTRTHTKLRNLIQGPVTFWEFYFLDFLGSPCRSR